MFRFYLYLIIVLLLVLNQGIFAQTISIEGVIKDKKTKEPLPYASVTVKERFLGTMSGPEGQFTLYLPDSLINDTLQINHLGYNSFETPINIVANSVIEVKLKLASTNIEAVVIKPFLPEDILRLAIQNIQNNYPQQPFKTEGFYIEELIENDIYINFAEAFVEIYSPPFGDTSKCQAKIIQGRSRDSLGQVKFLEELVQKKYEKAIKKADRKGDTVNADDYNGVEVNFGGPKSVLLTDLVRSQELFLDSMKHKKFDFRFEPDNSLGDRKLYVIRCESKKPIEHAYIDALVYIDKETYAVVKITSNNTLKLPGYVKAMMGLLRMKVASITFTIDNEFRMVNSVWYPNKVLFSFYGDATKKYGGGKMDHGVFTGRQAYTATNIKTNNVKMFDKTECMVDDKELVEQFGNYNPDFWENRTKIEYSVR